METRHSSTPSAPKKSAVIRQRLLLLIQMRTLTSGLSFRFYQIPLPTISVSYRQLKRVFAGVLLVVCMLAICTITFFVFTHHLDKDQITNISDGTDTANPFREVLQLAPLEFSTHIPLLVEDAELVAALALVNDRLYSNGYRSEIDNGDMIAKSDEWTSAIKIIDPKSGLLADSGQLADL